jgi:adenosylcobinamide-GDP ribazoletransferase
VRSLRLSVGLLTILPTGDVGVVDRRVAGRAMLWAPVVGAVIAVIPAAIVWAVHAASPTALGSLLAATLGVGSLAYLTRALHLDGLADTADALGSGKAADVALSIARRGDVGPFGVITVVLVLLIQIAALAVLTDNGAGAGALLVAVMTGRLAATLACSRGIPAARPDGLGALVAGTVPRSAVAAWIVAVALVAVALGLWLTPEAPWALPIGVLVGLGVAALLVRRGVRRLGGVTGDVVGAAVEVAVATALVVTALTATVSA